MNHIQALFKEQDMVRDIVLRFPKSADYFRGRKIDFAAAAHVRWGKRRQSGGFRLKRCSRT
ncbi:hypothetical protein HMSSN036_09850 [Paenibacillus macerans]|nr:hypothetical protein HMSSN036_09850 [Paenibacillus macerans]